MLTTLEKIKKAMTDPKKYGRFNVGNQLFMIEREDLIRGYRYNLSRVYFAGLKVQLKAVSIRDNVLPPDHKKCFRKFLEEIFVSCTYHVYQGLNKYTSRSVRKSNRIYHCKNQWDRGYNVEKVYDRNGVFCGWGKQTYLTW